MKFAITDLEKVIPEINFAITFGFSATAEMKSAIAENKSAITESRFPTSEKGICGYEFWK